MKKKVLVFFPHNPWPPRSGAHRRCLGIIGGLRDLGYHVTLASSVLSTDNPWSDASIEGLTKQGLSSVHVYETTTGDHEFLSLMTQLRATTKSVANLRAIFYFLRQLLKQHPPIAATLRGLKKAPPINDIERTPPGMRRWFVDLTDQIEPDVIIMNYAYWDGLLNHRRLVSAVRVIDTLDLVSSNRAMQHAIARHLPEPLAAAMTPDEVLREDFFEPFCIDAGADEFHIFDKYDRTIAITAKEVELIRRHTRRTKVSWLPVTLEPAHITNMYSDSALFTVGPNLFNTQGYLYFVKKVLPLVMRKSPSFILRVTGRFPYNTPQAAPGITLTGFVPDLRGLYETARFFVCPVFGGTGQQIKIVEAMAHGLPVVALRFAAERSPLRHEVSGLVAENAEEFAEHTLRLWNDPALCRRLGTAAREAIAEGFSQRRLLEGLSDILGIEGTALRSLE
jgi:glycosyltransferase involved in cell wall biosynthesis